MRSSKNDERVSMKKMQGEKNENLSDALATSRGVSPQPRKTPQILLKATKAFFSLVLGKEFHYSGSELQHLTLKSITQIEKYPIHKIFTDR